MPIDLLEVTIRPKIPRPSPAIRAISQTTYCRLCICARGTCYLAQWDCVNRAHVCIYTVYCTTHWLV